MGEFLKWLLARFVARFYPRYIHFAEHFQPCSTTDWLSAVAAADSPTSRSLSSGRGDTNLHMVGSQVAAGNWLLASRAGHDSGLAPRIWGTATAWANARALRAAPGGKAWYNQLTSDKQRTRTMMPWAQFPWAPHIISCHERWLGTANLPPVVYC